MPAYTLRIRRYDPQSGEAAYWDDHTIEMRAHNSVLDAILKVRGEVDGSLGIRCSCQQGICGSCGVRMNGKPGLACNTHLDEAARRGHGVGWNPAGEGNGAGGADIEGGDGDGHPPALVTVEPMGNMPVIRDLIVDMDAVHWKKIQRVTPWLINKEPIPEREYVVPHENMIDVTQPMACIQCGACVSDCLSMEIDPLFVGPAALAKAYRFVGDPRDAEQFERLKDLSEDPHGIYDCTHCFNCIDACPKGVDPMSQIMRLRRIAGSDHEIDDRNNGYRHEHAFVKNIRKNGLLNEADLLPDSYGGKFHPRAVPELIQVLPTAAKALARRKLTPKTALLHPHKAPKAVRALFDKVEGRQQRNELNIYVTGYEDDPKHAAHSDEPTPLQPPAPPDARPPEEQSAKEDRTVETVGLGERQPPSETSAPRPEGPAEPDQPPRTEEDA